MKWALALALVLATKVAHAEAASDAPQAVTVVVRGGASLGSFEAGTLHAFAEIVRADPGRFDLRVLAGTSAGSINALISAFELFGASPPARDPERSLYYRTWIPIGTKGMFDARSVSATGAFTRSKAMAKVVSHLVAVARQGLREGVEVLLAVPVTRVTSRRIDMDAAGSLQAQQAGETFVVRLRGRGAARLPSITNVHDGKGPRLQPSLVTDAHGEVSLRSLIDLVLASSAIPPAFAPVKIAHCLTPKQPEGVVRCDPAEATAEPFVDGGFLDNLPLGTAAALSKNVADVADASYLLVDPQEATFTRPAVTKQDDRSFQILGERLAGGLFETVQSAELRAVLDRDEHLGEQLSVLQSELPLASSPLQSFLGFFEEEFRTFDFALGMHETRRLARERFRNRAFERPVRVPPATLGSPVRRRLACLEFVIDGMGEASSCAGADLVDFRALLQTSFDRLAVRCVELDAAGVRRLRAEQRVEAMCKAIAQGAAPPRVPGVELDDDWPARASERSDVLAYTVRRLHAHGFHWTDLGIGHASAGRARIELALRVGEILRAFAAAQPQNSLLFRSAARALAQQLEYVPPAHAFHLLSGPTIEVGYSVTRRAAPYRSLRLAGALLFDGIPSLLTADTRSYFAVTPELGVEFESPFLARSSWQVRALARGGFQFSTGDTFGAGDHTPTTPRSRPVIDAAIALSLLQWVRLQVGVAVFPPFRGEAVGFAVRPGLGVQLDLPL